MSESRRPWTDKEDEAIKNLVKKYGVKRWADVSQQLQSRYKIFGRTGKQCRQRWHNHLNPDISKQAWSPKQQQIIFEAHRKYGNQWTAIAKLLQGRTDNSIKNFFYSTLRKSMRKINKMIGSKNGNQMMKTIKPCVLSEIFYYSGLNKKQITEQNKQTVQDCKNISQMLVQFSNNTQRKNVNANTKMQFENLMDKLFRFNQRHQQISQLQKKRKSQFMQEQQLEQDNQKDSIGNTELKKKQSQRSLRSSKKFHMEQLPSELQIKRRASAEGKYKNIGMKNANQESQQFQEIDQEIIMNNNLNLSISKCEYIAPSPSCTINLRSRMSKLNKKTSDISQGGLSIHLNQTGQGNFSYGFNKSPNINSYLSKTPISTPNSTWNLSGISNLGRVDATEYDSIVSNIKKEINRKN